ncbi:E3 ubiquitin-protein ligase SINAT2-like [Primulina tabacum]|uniref:E3 ubiquitin-protein ligase SINAT2-like n=1 Tax=Primulina tabacum TaxID=48773 RepID=UPI003F5A4377
MAPRTGSCTDATESHSKYGNYRMLMKEDIVHNRKNAIVLREKHGLKGVQELLQCRACPNSTHPPIQQCPNGHILCVNCKRLHNCCPTCQIELGNLRCLALEKVTPSLELPCRYQSSGCNNIFLYHGKIKHEKNCPFRPYSCPHVSSECHVTGDIPFLVAHMKEDHAVDMHDGCTFIHRYVKSNPCEVENAIWMLTVFNCFGRHFCLHFEAFLLGTVPVYMAFIRFMGEDCMAKKFSYTLEVKACGRKLVWQGVPRSIRDSHSKVRDSQDGLIIPRSLALCFSGGDGERLKLRITGRIWKV